MSLGNCLVDLQARKLISDQRAEELRGVYDELVGQYEGRYGRAAAESMATEKTLKLADLDAMHKKRQTLLQVKAQQTIRDQARLMTDRLDGDQAPISGRAVMALLVRDEKAKGLKNVEMQAVVIANDARRMLLDFLTMHRRNVVGQIRNKAELKDIVRARFGEAVDDINLKEISDSIGQTFEWLRSRANAAGARIAKLDEYGLPQSHDGYRVGQVARADWVEYILPKLDRARMIDRATGAPMNEGRLRLMLGDAYENIVSDGAVDRMPSGQNGGRSYANRRTDHRQLHFKDADTWMEYNDRFGTATPLDAVTQHIDAMSFEIAAMEVMGPNPEATLRYMRDLVDNEAKTKGTMKDRAAATIKDYEMEKVWQDLSGQNRTPVRRNLALFGGTLRNWNVATKLGFAAISALSDHSTRWLANSYAGLPQTKLMGQYLRLINPLSGSDRDWARRNLIVVDEVAGGMAGYNRFHIDENNPGRLWRGGLTFDNAMEGAHEFSRRLADGAMRATGLSPHTVASREAGAMQFISNLSHHKDIKYADLPELFRGMLDRHGFGEGSWDEIRGSALHEFRDMEWILPENIANQELRDAVMRAQFIEVDMGTPTSSSYARAMLRPDRPGTIKNELVAGAAQFKMFPVLITIGQVSRMAAMSSWKGRAGYATAMLGSSTLAGALSVQLYEIANGRDPLPMNDPDFIKKAMLKAGGLGVFGDTLKMSENEYGQDLTDITVGPQIGTIQNVADVAWAGGRRGVAALTEDEVDDADTQAKLGRSTRNLLRRETPLLNSWYTKLGYERLLVDWVSEAVTGESIARSYQRTEQYANEQGTSYWAPPGAVSSAGTDIRAPDMGNALGAEDELQN
jgi:hypothetical protein